MGGAEFVLLSGVDDPAEALNIAAALTSAIGEPFLAGDHEVQVSASVSIAIFPDNGANPRELLSNADTAMYHAKSLGRNYYCFFEGSMHADVYEQMQIANELRAAISQG
ncbi:diguanylate cyclase/phosphodiesterase (GGDEF & EAL domain) with PAS/PAC sensor(s) [Candidatus Paraburkholderia calva]|nr:diguanylate cyclase/phosphodiesterase (GGDEF & EAL domain) with PAS/PAC sensor(s) [Candidatus Paraburkholderia calva]